MNSKAVFLNELLSQYEESGLNYKLPIVLGKNENGKSEFADLVDLEHILMAGSTGSGKSIFGHSIISTFIKIFSPAQLRLFLIDMKVVEFPSFYNGLPHLLAPVATGFDKAFNGLGWVRNEKNSRLRKSKSELKKMPYIVIVIDTFSDLIINYSKRFQKLIKETLDKAAEAKIYFIIYDSRPSPDVFTPLIRASFPTRICFNVSRAVDSKITINNFGGEKLLGKGDMLLLKKGSHRPIHLQAPFISEQEIKEIVNHAINLKQ